RDALAAHLREQRVGTDVHYPIPDHRQPIMAERYRQVSLPVTERACTEVLSLPCFPELTAPEVDYVIETCNTWKPSSTP
ncbi:MAG: DegT/DnrJ/EryC1/StrS family aminotransferase, partial [Pseudomonadota bacterium]|nr:DegT/DnrJ/EryC1/StrS family aminotransferase [Pseudomonadota bacterium]